MLANGWTVAASLYVTLPSGSVAPLDAYRRSARTPPGFWIATCAPSDEVAHRLTSASRLLIVDSPPRFSWSASDCTARLRSAVIEPSDLAPRAAEFVTAASTIACTVGSAGAKRPTESAGSGSTGA